jgi:hypothetical protein
MNKFFLLFIALIYSNSYAQNDTLQIQAQEDAQLTWYGNYDSNVVFPVEGSYEKIIMDFTMGCADGGCSHWDYTVSIYLMEPTGLLDSSVSVLDTISIEPLVVDTTWNVYEVLEKFELGRLITPYGNYMDWVQPSDPNDVFDDSWEHLYQFDVTDFAPLLQDSSLIRVHYGGWSSGFSATVKFDFIEGTPPREVLNVENMYPVGGYSYQSLADDVNYPSIVKSFEDNVEGLAVKSYVSGHGHEGPQNCCEWVSKQHGISINNEEIYQWYVWKDCGMIPVYPQGGTWPFDRAGWCPGTTVDEQISELTDFVDLDSEVLIDYNVQPYSDNGEEAGSFIVSNTLFTYAEINFSNDIEVLDILKPTKKDKWSRMNPICANPIIEIRNRGSEFLTNATIEYGIEGGELSTFEWSGAMEFMESSLVELPSPNWSGANESSKFIATVILEDDEYLNNNSLSSDFDIPEVLPSEFVFEFKTQSNYNSTNRAAQSSFYVYDMNGNVVFEHYSGLVASTWYKDTLNLPFGCYEIVFEDSAEDGVNEHWYYGESAAAAGKVQIRNMDGDIFKKFPDDFGQQIDFRFTVDYPLEIHNINKGSFDVYPNPADNYLVMSLSLSQIEDVVFALYNNLGEEVYRSQRGGFSVGNETIDTSHLTAGIYYCKAITSNMEQVKKFVLVE